MARQGKPHENTFETSHERRQVGRHWWKTVGKDGEGGGKGYAGTDKPENRSRGHAAGFRVRRLIRKAKVFDARYDTASIILSAIGTKGKKRAK